MMVYQQDQYQAMTSPYGGYGTQPYYGGYMPGGQQYYGYPYQTPTGTGGLQVPPMPAAPQQTSAGQYVPGMLPLEESYIENILRLNKGKMATVYMTFENNREWNAKIFKGVIEAAGRDHIIISDPQTGQRYLLLMVYLDYIVFDEEIEYQYPAGLSTYPPR
jgi:spore germination protein Q